MKISFYRYIPAVSNFWIRKNGGRFDDLKANAIHPKRRFKKKQKVNSGFIQRIVFVARRISGNGGTCGHINRGGGVKVKYLIRLIITKTSINRHESSTRNIIITIVIMSYLNWLCDVYEGNITQHTLFSLFLQVITSYYNKNYIIYYNIINTTN